MSAPSTSGLSVIKSYCYELSTLNKVYFTLLYFTDIFLLLPLASSNQSFCLSTESAIDDVQLDHGDLLVIVSYSKYPKLQEPRNKADLGYEH